LHGSSAKLDEVCGTLRDVRVLVVEDERRLAETIRSGLEREGFAVDVAHDGEESLWRATELRYDAVVLDIMLPKRDGFEVCAHLRAAGVWSPILMLTARGGDLDHAKALDTGADDFLTKPFSFVVLVAHLRALMRRGRSERPAVLAAGDLRLDSARHLCWRGEQPIELTPRQFSLLELLMSRAGEVLSKTEIVNHIWDDAFEGDLNIVEVYIGYLRKKIDLPFGRNAIQTLRRVGYRLAPDGG
jgi:DNA-binding response OmpR family regulator